MFIRGSQEIFVVSSRRLIPHRLTQHMTNLRIERPFSFLFRREHEMNFLPFFQPILFPKAIHMSFGEVS
jgi:hypothetical protein